jgi:ADP-glucose pyrophosphorylase
MSGSEIGRYSRLRRAIVPANVVLPESTVIGYDLDSDRAKGYTVTDSGVVIVPPVPEQHLTPNLHRTLAAVNGPRPVA